MGDVPDRLTSALQDRYRVERRLGQGGMASVYLAHDLRHERKVAIKVLRPELAAVLGTERFLAEIRTTANLQHPHLLPLFDSGEVDGQLFYVMPYVEGESLRARLERERQLPVEEAIRVATAVAGALDYAHRHGVIHRDLKPENVLLHDGQPLVADFGIALAVSNAGGARITQTGLSLGTPAYMSPEQATGDRHVDGRSDIYSLAAITYEMLAGDPPHVASTSQALIAKLLTEKPQPPSAVRETVPAHVDAAVLKALAKLPADRFGSAGAFGEALRGVGAVEVARRGSGPRPWRRWVPVVTGAAGAILGIVIGPALSAPDPVPSTLPSARFQLRFPDAMRPVVANVSPSLTISADGSTLAYRDADQMYVWRLSEPEGRPLEGLAQGVEPHFSPDGEWLLYWHQRTLKKVMARGGTPLLIADSVGVYGSSWDGETVLFTRDGALWRVSAQGGDPALVAAPDSSAGVLWYRWPHLLPGGDAAVVTVGKRTEGTPRMELATLRLATGETVELGEEGVDPRYAAGRILWGRTDGSLLAADFSLSELALTSVPTLLLNDVLIKPDGGMELAVSDNGMLVYLKRDSGDRRLAVVDRDGRATPIGGPPRAFHYPRVSRDGRRLAVTIGTPFDVWIYEMSSSTLSRLTSDGMSERPEWMPDGRRIALVEGSLTGGIMTRPWDGSGEAEPYLQGGPATTSASFGAAGTWAAFRRGGPDGGDIWIAPVDSPAAVRRLLATPANEVYPRVSPDGQLLAYRSDESQSQQIYVRPLPGPGPRIQVSVDRGTEPVWSPDSRQLFYRTFVTGGHLIAATIARQPELAVVRRDTLFADDFVPAFGLSANYDVFPDGERFLMIVDDNPDDAWVAIVNWVEELRRRSGGEAR